MILKISDNICPTMVLLIQKFKKFRRNTSRDTISYFTTVASEDRVFCHTTIVYNKNSIANVN